MIKRCGRDENFFKMIINFIFSIILASTGGTTNASIFMQRRRRAGAFNFNHFYFVDISLSVYLLCTFTEDI